MKLSCPSCSAKYSIADEKVQDRLAKIRCRKCSATIIVDGKVNPPNVYTADGASAGADIGDAAGGEAVSGEYSVDFGDNDQRSMSAEDIIRACRRGEMSPDMYVWSEGMSDWTPISQVPALASALGGSVPPAAAAAPRAAARSGTGRGSAHDLFGGIDRAGSEEEVMTSAPGPAAPQAGAATGARNESSVLFSLSALTASAPAAAPAPGKSSAAAASVSAGGDDSGLIDLKALTTSAGSQPPAGPLGLGSASLGLGAPPLGMAAPLGGVTAPAMAVDGPMPKAAGSKTGVYIAGALAFAALVIGGAIVMTSNKEAPAAPAPTTPVAAAAPTPAPEPKKEEPTAQPPATGTAAAEAAPSAAPPVKASAPSKTGAVAHYSSKKSSGGAAPADKPADKPASAPPPSSDSSGGDSSGDKPKKKKKEKSCNCSPGDLMCAMKCAAG